MIPERKQAETRRQGAAAWWGVLGLAALVAALSLLHTWPLAVNWVQGIPYVYHASPGWERVPGMPGDHLQFYYWSWLLIDNLLGPSSFFTNPYEFSTFINPHGIALYANFPFSLLYLALYPLGQIPAYNAMVLVSYLLAGLMAFALARQMLGSWLAALPAALAFALLPFRASQALSGHLYGFIAFLLPLTLWCLERGWQRRSWLWGAGGGLCLLAVGMMEGHLIYYSTLLLGLYVPLRLLLRDREYDPLPENSANWPALAWALLAGLGLGCALHLAAARAQGAAFFSPGLAVGLGLGLACAIIAWLLASWLARGLTSLDLAKCRAIMARALLPLVLSPLYALQYWLDLPHAGKALVLLLAIAGLVICLPPLWRARRLPRLPKGTWPPLAALGVGWALGVGAMMINKAQVMDDSIASKGRSLAEVKLYAPQLGDLFQLEPVHAEQTVYLGILLAALGLAGLVMLALGRPRGAKGGALASLWALLAALAGLLCLGPNLPQLPLYGLLYKHLPFFNFPRVPGRIVIIAVLFLALLAGWALKALLSRWQGRRLAAVLAGVLVAGLIAWDYWPPTPTGICLLPPAGALQQGLKTAVPTGPDAAKRVLGLPIWPGDSHQSSAYELLISGTRARMVNGYSPLVPRAYVDQVFWPLYPLDFGSVTPEAMDTLRRLKVGLSAFYLDEEVYTRKVCPFPPELALRRLIASGVFQPLVLAETVFLLRPSLDAAPKDVSHQVSPITSLWEAAWLRRSTGRLVEERNASGWGLLFAEQDTPQGSLGGRLVNQAGNVAQAKAGVDKPGWLALGPGRPFPPGRYVARFWMRRGPGQEPGFVEAADKQSGKVLANLALSVELLPADGKWHQVRLPFELKQITWLNLGAYFSGKSDLDLDRVLINFSGQEEPQPFYEASRLWRQTGTLVVDKRAPGGHAVLGKAGWHPPLYLMHGPQQTYGPGRYVARFRLALPSAAPAGAEAAMLVVATDLGRKPLGHVLVRAGQLGREYKDIEVPFEMKRSAEVGLRVLFKQGASILVAGAGVKPAN